MKEGGRVEQTNEQSEQEEALEESVLGLCLVYRPRGTELVDDSETRGQIL